MGGLMSRNKGKRGEREIVELLQPVVNEVYDICGKEPPKLKRNTLQCDSGGCDIAGLAWLGIEVKFHADLKVDQWWRQTVEQVEPGQIPVLFYRRNNMKWKVKMYGMLGTPGCGYTVPVIVEVPDFLLWFRGRLLQELNHLPEE